MTDATDWRLGSMIGATPKATGPAPPRVTTPLAGSDAHSVRSGGAKSAPAGSELASG